MRVNEIFYSLQGEGSYAGTPAVFVRLSGCNLKCPFCDTRHEAYQEYTDREILQEIMKYSPCRFVVITGGEPCLQLTGELVNLLHEHNCFVAIETNGTIPLCDGIDWVVCSPKVGFCPDAGLKLQHIDELKVVYNGKGQDMSLYDDIRAEEYCLQPCDVGDADENRRILAETIDYIKAHPKWRLSLQTHKLLGIR